MKASFGALEGAELSLTPGLNVIEAPNESGKSTWCGFIRTMLYGISTSQREKAGVLPDKRRYLPWGNYPMSGEMAIEWRGGGAVLARSGAAGKPMGPCAARGEPGGEKLPELSVKAPGETLLGVPESVFTRTAFINGSDMAVSHDGELEKRISALVSAGSEEDESYGGAREVLRAWQRSRYHNSRVGRLNELERERGDLESALARIGEENARLAGLFEEKGRLSARKSFLERQLALHSENEAWQVSERAQRIKSEREAAQRHYDEAKAAAAGADREKIRAAREALRECENARAETERAEDALELVLAARSDFEEERLGAKKGASPALFFVLAALAALGGVACAVFALWPAVAALAAALCALAALGVRFSLARRRNAEDARAREAEISDKINAAEAALNAAREREMRANEAADAEICGALRGKDAENALSRCETLLEDCIRAEAAFSAAVKAESELAPDAANAAARPSEAPQTPRREAESELGAVALRLENVARELALAEGGLQSLGDPLVLATRLEGVKDEISRARKEYEALELALSVLDEANGELQNRFAPIVAGKVGELMAELTSGAYDKIGFDRDFNFTALAGGVMREADFLSSGTLAQLYLAVRLALCLTVLPDGECPIVLDDAFISFDDERARAALRLLKKLAEKRQIIVFTCQSREKRLLAEME
jgi:hypothetical protein